MAVKKIGAARFREAADYFARIHSGVVNRKAEDVVKDFIADKKKPSQPNALAKSDRYVSDMNCRLKRFA